MVGRGLKTAPYVPHYFAGPTAVSILGHNDRMKASALVMILGVLALSATPALQSRSIAVRVGAAVLPDRTLADAVIVVEGERIARIDSGDPAVPAGANVIDLRPLTAIPGLIDVHTHMT